jgi:hypothetical protein
MEFPAPGRRVGVPRGRWIRGTAKLEGGFVVIDGPFVEWTPEVRGDRVGPGDPIVELAAVRDPADVLGFARRFGLLWHDASREPRESLEAWINEARLLSSLLRLYVDLRGVMNEPTPERLKDFRLVWQPLIGGKATDAAFRVDAGRMLADVISSKLEGVQERVSVLASDDGIERFVFDSEAPALLALIYHQFALLTVGHAYMRACADPRCGRFFTPTDGRQRFCSPQHATRARVRRHREGDQA